MSQFIVFITRLLFIISMETIFRTYFTLLFILWAVASVLNIKFVIHTSLSGCLITSSCVTETHVI